MSSNLKTYKVPRILFVIGSLECGGAEKQLVTLASQIQLRTNEQSYACHIFTLQDGGSLLDNLILSGIPVHRGGMRKGDVRKAPWKLMLAQLKLLNIVQKIKPTIIHAFLPLVTFMGALTGRLARVPIVVTSRRALGTHQERFPLLRALDLAANSLSHIITVNSRAVWEDIVKRDHADESKLVLIYNGIDVAPFQSARRLRESIRRKLGIKPFARVVVAVANFIPYKGHLDLVHAAELVVREFPSTIFILVGEDRGTQGNIQRQVQIKGLSDNFSFLGQRFDIPEILAGSDISVLPSHEEGFSNVILEYMAAGLPVVATKVGGNAEAVIDGSTGWLVPPRNPRMLAEKIADLIRDSKKALLWGERGMQRVTSHFSIERMVDNHLKLYKKGVRDKGERCAELLAL